MTEKENTTPITEEAEKESKPLEINEEVKERIVEQFKQEAIKNAGISDKDAENFEKILDEALMPVNLTDKDFKLGARELDIRNLSNKNKYQMFFRSLVLQTVRLNNIQSSLLDLTRLFMVLLDKLGVEDVVKATDDVLEKLSEQQGLKNFRKDKIN